MMRKSLLLPLLTAFVFVSSNSVFAKEPCKEFYSEYTKSHILKCDLDKDGDYEFFLSQSSEKKEKIYPCWKDGGDKNGKVELYEIFDCKTKERLF